MSARVYDVILIGAGHNGLTCAAYLARAGLDVLVLERQGVVGGAAVTEEFHPGFRNSVASYTVSLLNPKVIADLDLHRHNLRVVERKVSNFLPLPGGDYFLSAPGQTQAQALRGPSGIQMVFRRSARRFARLRWGGERRGIF